MKRTKSRASESSKEARGSEGPGSTPPPGASSPRRWRPALAVTTGLLMVLAYPRYGHELGFGLEHLIWVTLLPLFLATRGVGGRGGLRLGWLCGLTLECSGFVWILFAIRSFTQTNAVVSSLLFFCWLVYTTIPWAILGWSLGRARRPRDVWLGTIPLWVGLEHFYPRLFPWHVGGALWGSDPVRQVVDLTGASGLTALAFLTSASLFFLLEWRRKRAGFPALGLAFTLLALLGAFGYGAWRQQELASELEATAALRVAILQGALEPGDENELATYLERTRELLAAEGSVDLIVWPEGIGGTWFVLERPGKTWLLLEDDKPRELAALRSLPAPLVIGGAGFTYDKAGEVEERFNVAAYFAGSEEPRFYRKIHRIPFGENVPGLELLPEAWRRQFGHIGTLSAGRENALWSLGEHRFRNAICYEVVLPDHVREAAAGAGFLVNITEDIWYGRTAHVGQHLSVLVLRSLESRIPIVRAANAGPSGITDLVGHFHSAPTSFAPAAFVAPLRPSDQESVYERFGHHLPLAALLLGALAHLLPRRPRED